MRPIRLQRSWGREYRSVVDDTLGTFGVNVEATPSDGQEGDGNGALTDVVP